MASGGWCPDDRSRIVALMLTSACLPARLLVENPFLGDETLVPRELKGPGCDE